MSHTRRGSRATSTEPEGRLPRTTAKPRWNQPVAIATGPVVQMIDSEQRKALDRWFQAVGHAGKPSPHLSIMLRRAAPLQRPLSVLQSTDVRLSRDPQGLLFSSTQVPGPPHRYELKRGTFNPSRMAPPATTRRDRRRAAWVLGLLAMAILPSACVWSLDPNCYRSGHGASIRKNGPLLLLTVTRHGPAGGFVKFEIDRSGGADYARAWAEGPFTCQRFSEEDLGTLAELWSVPELQRVADADCVPGLSFRWMGRVGDRHCPEAYREWTPARPGPFQQLRLTWYSEDGYQELYWDLESALPEPLRRSVVGTVAAACAKSEEFGRHLHEQFSSFAGEVGCRTAVAER